MKVSKNLILVMAAVLMVFFVTAASQPLVPMVRIPGGTFTMGATTDKPFSGDGAAHQVTVSPFMMGQTEITQKQFRTVMGFYPGEELGDDYPAENLTWFDAVAFCNELSLLEGLKPAYTITALVKKDAHLMEAEVTCDWTADGYRLPTEAEWEYAAKGGVAKQKQAFSGSSKVDKVAWHAGNSGMTVKPVAQKKGNKFGLFDMSGNAWEWCWDWYGNYLVEAQTDPRGAEFNPQMPYRIQRGGSSCNEVEYASVSYRYGTGASLAAKTFGFRVVRSQAR